jgi:hypothetical protein
MASGANVTFRVDKSIIDPPGIFQACLHGSNDYRVSIENAQTLVRRFSTAPLNGVIIDYSGCTLGHTMQQYNDIAATFGDGLPDGLPFAYVFNEKQVAHVLFMTRLLTGKSLQARAFPSMEEAHAWIIPAAGLYRENREQAA